MIRTMMRTTMAAAGFAALLLTGACAHSNTADTTNRVVEVRPDNAANTGVAPGPAIADSDGNVYSSSAAPGRGNPATVGTNTNVNNISTNRVEVSESTVMTPVEPTATVETTQPITTTTTETVVAPMTSATQETTTTKTTEETKTTATTTTPRKRLRKD